MPAETSQTLDRGLRVLDVLTASPGGLTVTELAARLGVNRTVVYRLVSTLEQHALVRRDGRGRLHVGLGVLHLAAAVQPVLRDLAVPVLRSLAEKAGCTAHLTVADGEEALALAVVEPSWTDFHVELPGRLAPPAAPGGRRQGDPARPRARRRGRTPSPRASCRRAPAGWPRRSAGSRGSRPASASSRSAHLDTERIAPHGRRGRRRGRRPAQLRAHRSARASGRTR